MDADDRGAAERVSPFYIPIETAARSTARRRVLKNGDCFAVFDDFGNLDSTSAAEGLFYEDTRYLSRLVLTLNGAPPLLLSSTITEDNLVLAVDLTNPDLIEDGKVQVVRDTVHVARRIFLGVGSLFDRLELKNFGHRAVCFAIAVDFDADFVDIFEVRGTARARRGTFLPDRSIATEERVMSYRGLDGVSRETHTAFTPAPLSPAARRAEWRIELQPREEKAIEIAVRFARHGQMARIETRDGYWHQATRYLTRRQEGTVDIYTTNETFNDWANRSSADLNMLVTETSDGLYPYAGIPWFSTAFGRDGIITALQCLWRDPELARGTLRFLAARQAASVDPAADAEPGKILHETRQGEMARLGEVPFERYYGSVDATPLFVVLAAAYYARTGDRDFARTLWSNVEAALGWMAKYGDSDGDGFLEYGRQSSNGLVNQGWKDSADSIFHAEGRLAEGPIALCEVQAYAYAAYRGAAELASALGLEARSVELTETAAILAQRFNAAFWIDELGSYALALDGDKRPCRVRASNAGHVLFCGLATHAHAHRVAQTLMDEASFSGWGIRTIAKGEARYNPMSYHNGSVWPHDNGLIAMGLARYGLKDALLKLLTGLFDAALFMEMKRMPELFCGFERRHGAGPTSYPVACIPQAWSSAAVFAMLGASLGISFDAEAKQIRFTRPLLPRWLERVRLRNVRLGSASVDLLLQRSRNTAALYVERRDGPVEVVVTA